MISTILYTSKINLTNLKIFTTSLTSIVIKTSDAILNTLAAFIFNYIKKFSQNTISISCSAILIC